MRTPAALRKRVLSRIRPTPAQTKRARAAATELGRRLRAQARAEGFVVRPELVGSLAKGTHAKPLDVDVFVLFPPQTPRAVLEKEALALAARFLRNVEFRYAEHPYAHGTYRGFAFDVVPAYRVTDVDGRLSAVDRTPFHTRYVRQNLSRSGRDEVRLLKQWLRGVGAYGAETAVGGVSGYLAELLVLRFGSFDATVAAMATWGDSVKLALHGEDTALGGAVVFVDPVDPQRNAAAAVTSQKLALMRRAARAYEKSPSWRFFFPRPAKPPTTAEVRPLVADSALTGLEVPAPKTRAQATVPHLQRLLAKVVRLLTSEGFRVTRAKVISAGRDYILAWDTDPARLASRRRHRGPRLEDSEHAERFRARWAGRSVEVAEGRLWVDVPVARRTSAQVVSHARRDLVQGAKWTPQQVKRLRVVAGPDWLRSPRRRLAAWLVLAEPDPWEI